MVSKKQWKPFNARSSELMRRRMSAGEWATSDIGGKWWIGPKPHKFATMSWCLRDVATLEWASQDASLRIWKRSKKNWKNLKIHALNDKTPPPKTFYFAFQVRLLKYDGLCLIVLHWQSNWIFLCELATVFWEFIYFCVHFTSFLFFSSGSLFSALSFGPFVTLIHWSLSSPFLECL